MRLILGRGQIRIPSRGQITGLHSLPFLYFCVESARKLSVFSRLGPVAIQAAVAEFSKLGVIFEMQHMSVVDDVAYIVWNAETDDNIYQIGTDTFVVKDGKIMKQTFTTLTVSKK